MGTTQTTQGISKAIDTSPQTVGKALLLKDMTYTIH